MSILDRDALAASPLADLHALASELSIDGYRRLRKSELIDAILTRQGGAPAADEWRRAAEEPAAEESAAEEPAAEQSAADTDEGAEEEKTAGRRRRGRRGGRGRAGARDEEDDASREEEEDEDAARARDEQDDGQLTSVSVSDSASEVSERTATTAKSLPSARAAAGGCPRSRPRTRSSRARSSSCRTGRASCASTRQSPPRTTCTCRPRRSSAASSCRAIASQARAAPRDAPSASRR